MQKLAPPGPASALAPGTYALAPPGSATAPAPGTVAPAPSGPATAPAPGTVAPAPSGPAVAQLGALTSTHGGGGGSDRAVGTPIGASARAVAAAPARKIRFVRSIFLAMNCAYHLDVGVKPT